MEEEGNYLQELLSEKESLDSTFVHCMRLITTEINRVQSGGSLRDDDSVKNGMKQDGNDDDLPEGGRPHRERGHRENRPWRRHGPPVEEGKLYKPVKLSEKVFIPIKDHPKFNFVGKLLGPRGNTFKRLQNMTGTKMSILGKGSMRDKEKEEELRATEDAKYAHLSEELHVLIEVEAPPGQAHARLGIAIEEIKKYLIPEMNDEIHQEQMREMAILNSIEDNNNNQGSAAPPGPPGPPAPPQPVVRSRPRPQAVPPPHGHTHTITVPVPRPHLGLRPRVPLSAAARSIAGLPSSPTVAQPAPRSQAPHAGDPYGMQTVLIPKNMDAAHHISGVQLNETYDPAYAYEAAYVEAEEAQYYDYGQRVAPGELYETAYPAPIRLPASSYKAPPLRQAKKVREAAFPY